MDVPRSSLTRSDAVDIRFVQTEHGYTWSKPLRQREAGEPMKRRTCPPLGLPARIEIGDRTRTAVEAALHANKAEAAVAVGRRWCIGFVVITRCYDWISN